MNLVRKGLVYGVGFFIVTLDIISLNVLESHVSLLECP